MFVDRLPFLGRGNVLNDRRYQGAYFYITEWAGKEVCVQLGLTHWPFLTLCHNRLCGFGSHENLPKGWPQREGNLRACCGIPWTRQMQIYTCHTPGTIFSFQEISCRTLWVWCVSVTHPVDFAPGSCKNICWVSRTIDILEFLCMLREENSCWPTL